MDSDIFYYYRGQRSLTRVSSPRLLSFTRFSRTHNSALSVRLNKQLNFNLPRNCGTSAYVRRISSVITNFKLYMQSGKWYSCNTICVRAHVIASIV